MTEKRGKNITYASKHMATLWNPFSYKNAEPKYPDGLAQYSIGQKYHNHCVVDGEEILIILYPGLTNSVLVYGNAVEIPNENMTGLLYNKKDMIVRGMAPHADKGNLFTQKLDILALTQGPDQPQGISLIPTNKFTSWRPVSMALKIQPINNHDGVECGKDGWWEAVRQAGVIDFYSWGVAGMLQNNKMTSRLKPDAIADELNGLLLPTGETLERYQSSDDWVLQPSYSKGYMKDLSCWTFQLNNNMKDNIFTDIREVTHNMNPNHDANAAGFDNPYLLYDEEFHLQKDSWDRVPGRDLKQTTAVYVDKYKTKYPTAAVQVYNPNDTGPQRLQHLAAIDGFDTLFSKAFDQVAIKLHGRKGSRFLIQTVANIEYLAYNDSDLMEYMTTSYAAINELGEYLHIRNSDYKFANHNYFRDKLQF